ncbi:MAG: sigma-70 family RNA polymerase sigma factor [Deltaproteobacteria bacterium]|nr:sigma-70 family RNA polymerase sigma factor [Deltaproteobacteria bacterium]
MAAVALGDRAAFAALYRDLAPRLRGFLLTRTRGDRTQTDELVQETMLIVWKRASSYDPAKASVNTWVFTIARNRFIDRCRKALRPAPDPDDPSFVPAPETAPDDSLEQRRRAQKLHSALAQLPPDQRAVLEESYFQGKAQSAVAADMGVPLGTVKSRARLAMNRLRATLAEES